MEFTLYTANCSGNEQNNIYPNKMIISNAEQLKKAVSFDHVCAEYKNNRRSMANYICGNVDVMDCDNDHSDNPDDWITAEIYADLFPNVAYAIVPSRNNMKPKGSKSARPRHHVYFPHRDIKNASKCAILKRDIYAASPFFDRNALDSARFIYGCVPESIIWHEGGITIDEFLNEKSLEEYDRKTETINEGSRNSTMSHIAGKLIKRYGITDESYKIYLEKAQLCNPPLEDSELRNIWSSAVKFGKRVAQQAGYVPPEEYKNCYSMKPDDYSDIGQAKVLARKYARELVYTDSTEYMRYDGTHWVESKQMAVGACEEFVDLQLEESEWALERAMLALEQSGIDKDIIFAGGKSLEKLIDENSRQAFESYKNSLAYHKFVMKRRDMKYITSALQAAKPMLLKNINDFDNNEFLLNTPSGTYDLRCGLYGFRGHSAEDCITKITSVSPNLESMELWLETLDNMFCKDNDLIEYVQQIVGLAAIGKVYVEALIIAYGDGSNGKSTFWNTISKVLGSYSGGISADALTVGCKRNVKPEMAELKGKRLVIAAELEEGMRLNTSIVKQLCSTDEVSGEKKYKDPFKYVPTHTLVLYTNHLPKVGANDDGTWRRLIVIPFNSKVSKKTDIKNYADYLVQKAGGAVLSWIIEGAKKAIDSDFKFAVPKAVNDAIEKYRSNNDWLSIFIDECCEVDASYTQKSGVLYQEYRDYCSRNGEYTRSTTDFYAGLEGIGCKRKKTSAGNYITGIRLKSDFLID